MDLIATVVDKFVVSEDGIKVALNVRHGEGVLDFLHSVGGMRCDVYIKASTFQPSDNETSARVDDGQKDMFAGDGEGSGEADSEGFPESASDEELDAIADAQGTEAPTS